MVLFLGAAKRDKTDKAYFGKFAGAMVLVPHSQPILIRNNSIEKLIRLRLVSSSDGKLLENFFRRICPLETRHGYALSMLRSLLRTPPPRPQYEKSETKHRNGLPYLYLPIFHFAGLTLHLFNFAM